jgi:hypothetical protein
MIDLFKKRTPPRSWLTLDGSRLEAVVAPVERHAR